MCSKPNLSFILVELYTKCKQVLMPKILNKTKIAGHSTVCFFLQLLCLRQGFDCLLLLKWLMGNWFLNFLGPRLKWAIWPHQIFTNCTLPSFTSKASLSNSNMDKMIVLFTTNFVFKGLQMIFVFSSKVKYVVQPKIVSWFLNACNCFFTEVLTLD